MRGKREEGKERSSKIERLFRFPSSVYPYGGTLYSSIDLLRFLTTRNQCLENLRTIYFPDTKRKSELNLTSYPGILDVYKTGTCISAGCLTLKMDGRELLTGRREKVDKEAVERLVPFQPGNTYIDIYACIRVRMRERRGEKVPLNSTLTPGEFHSRSLRYATDTTLRLNSFTFSGNSMNCQSATADK